jgi:putative SOS response-associated peptidase YedK
MCRRFQIEPEELGHLEVNIRYSDLNLKKSTITVGDQAPVLIVKEKQIVCVNMVFGFQFFSDPLYNARIETISEKPTFSSLFDHYRCLIPVTEFYEEDKYHIDHGFTSINKLFFLAGIYSPKGFVILTQKPTSEVTFYHPRMPICLDTTNYSFFLDLKNSAEEIMSLTPIELKAEDSSDQLSLF